MNLFTHQCEWHNGNITKILKYLSKPQIISFTGVECPNPGTIRNGKVTPIFPQYLYRDYIQVYCEQGYKLMMVNSFAYKQVLLILFFF